MWKVLFATILAPVAVSLGNWGQNSMNGQHIPFTAGTILIPAVPVLLASLLHLFQTPPATGSKTGV